MNVDGKEEDVEVEVFRIGSAINNLHGIFPIEHGSMTGRVEAYVNCLVRHGGVMELVRLDSLDQALLVVDTPAGVHVGEVFAQELVERRLIFADKCSDTGLFDSDNLFASVDGEKGDGDRQHGKQEKELFHGGDIVKQARGSQQSLVSSR